MNAQLTSMHTSAPAVGPYIPALLQTPAKCYESVNTSLKIPRLIANWVFTSHHILRCQSGC